MVASKTPAGYTHITGTLKWRKNPRVSMLIQEGVKYKEEQLKLDVPTVCVNLDGWRIVGFYREWNRDGLAGTDEVPDQLERLQGLVKAMGKMKKQGRTLVIGDMNVDLYNLTDHQKKLEEL